MGSAMASEARLNTITSAACSSLSCARTLRATPRARRGSPRCIFPMIFPMVLPMIFPDIPDDFPNDIPREITREIPHEMPHDIPNDIAHDIPKIHPAARY